MIVQAQASGGGAQWSVADIEIWEATASHDVIFAKATRHWIGQQSSLLPRLFQAVSPGGTFAFQVPLNFEMPSHALNHAIGNEGPWATRVRDVRNTNLLKAPHCFAILEPYRAVLDIWDTEYLHVLDGRDAH